MSLADDIRAASNNAALDIGTAWSLLDDAADEIERLRAAITAIMEKHDKISREPGWDRQDQDRSGMFAHELRCILNHEQKAGK